LALEGCGKLKALLRGVGEMRTLRELTLHSLE